MSNVVDKIIAKCRGALLGGTPIIYIKTDSDVLMRKIIEYENQPLVQLICGSSAGGQRYLNRPLAERRADGIKCRIDDAVNYSNDLPKSFETISYPHIWVHKMPGMQDAAEYKSVLEKNREIHNGARGHKSSAVQYFTIQRRFVIFREC